MYLEIIKRIQAIPNIYIYIYFLQTENLILMGLTVNLLVQFCKEGLPYLAGPVQVSMGVHLSSVPVEPPFVDTRYHQFRCC